MSETTESIVLMIAKKYEELEQTDAVCIEAVKQDGNALRYVKEQTEAVCIEAVKRNGNALRYVKEQTEAVCIEAVKQDGDAVYYFSLEMEKHFETL